MGLIGIRSGKLVVTREFVKDERPHVECICDCGNTKSTRADSIKPNNKKQVKSCGCDNYKYIINIGQKYNFLTPMKRFKNNDYECKCDCGKVIIVKARKLVTEHLKSCGCLKLRCTNLESYTKEKNRNRDPEAAQINELFATYKQDKQMDIPLHIFKKLIKRNCYYCDSPPSNKMDNLIYNGLDRIDSSKGHTLDNVVTCCWACNRAKSNRNVNEFIKSILNFTVKPFSSPELIDLPKRPLLSSVIKRHRSYIRRYTKEDFIMSIEEFYTLCKQNCFYCGAEPSNCTNCYDAPGHLRDNAFFYYSGLDRYDIDGPHSFDNCVPCCKNCNWGKSNLKIDEFNGWMIKAKNHQHKMMYSNLSGYYELESV